VKRSMNLIGLVFGAMFGFVLAAGRLHDYDTIHATLRLESFYVFGLMGLAIGISAPLLWLLEKRQLATPYGGVLTLARSKIERHHIYGGALFGAGWSIAGTCPAPALAMLASGASYGGIAVAGLFIGLLARDQQLERSNRLIAEGDGERSTLPMTKTLGAR
jgi:uncharacterized protein